MVTSGLWRRLAHCAVVGLLSACGAFRWSTRIPECRIPPSRPLALTPEQAIALTGEYDFAVVADVGPGKHRVSRGSLHLEPADTLYRYHGDFKQRLRKGYERPLIGWANIDDQVIGLATAGVRLDSRDRNRPGVVSDVRQGDDEGMRLMLGYQPMLDGGFNEFVITRAEGNAFAGRWESGAGMTTYRAAGYFCATRRAEGDR